MLLACTPVNSNMLYIITLEKKMFNKISNILYVYAKKKNADAVTNFLVYF